MAFSMTESVRSRRVILAKDTESAVLEYVGYGDSDDAVARAAFNAFIPATFTPFSNPLVRLDFESWTLGGLFWCALAHFGPDTAPLFPEVGGIGPSPTPIPAVPGLNTPLGPDFAFDFSGVVEHITQSKATKSKFKRGQGADQTKAPDTKGAIGVTKDGQVQGTDRLRPNLEWSRTVTFASVTQQYINVISAMVGSANNATFYNRPAGSCIFMGGVCQTDDTFKAKVTFKFLDSPNLNLIDICPGLVVSGVGRPEAKLGSEYLWVSYENDKNTNRITQVPECAYVEQIADLVDFANLRIGA